MSEPHPTLRVYADASEACLAVGGVLTGEHGVGTEKREFMSLLFSDADLDAMMRLRRCFNPDGCCNPGKVLPVTRACVESNPAARNALLELIP